MNAKQQLLSYGTVMVEQAPSLLTALIPKYKLSCLGTYVIVCTLRSRHGVIGFCSYLVTFITGRRPFEYFRHYHKIQYIVFQFVHFSAVSYMYGQKRFCLGRHEIELRKGLVSRMLMFLVYPAGCKVHGIGLGGRIDDFHVDEGVCYRRQSSRVGCIAGQMRVS